MEDASRQECHRGISWLMAFLEIKEDPSQELDGWGSLMSPIQVDVMIHFSVWTLFIVSESQTLRWCKLIWTFCIWHLICNSFTRFSHQFRQQPLCDICAMCELSFQCFYFFCILQWGILSGVIKSSFPVWRHKQMFSQRGYLHTHTLYIHEHLILHVNKYKFDKLVSKWKQKTWWWSVFQDNGLFLALVVLTTEPVTGDK